MYLNMSLFSLHFWITFHWVWNSGLIEFVKLVLIALQMLIHCLLASGLLFMMRLWICLALFPWLKIFFPLAAFSILYFLSLLAYDYDPPCFSLYLCYFELAEIHGSVCFCTLLNLVNGGHYFFKNMSYSIVLLSDIIPHWLSVPFFFLI